MKKLERIMLVDDDPDTNMYNEIVLNQMNASENIIIFQNGKDALKYIVEKEDRIDLILLDINMPVMNGWQFVEEYEKLDKKKQTAIIVVMLTSSINIDDKLKAEAFNSVKKFINKPLTPKLIKEILALFE
jgi:CheY-like chemotaxis protein